MRRLLLVCVGIITLVALVVGLPAPLAAQVIPPPPPACSGFIYTVQPGDTMFLVAQRFGVSLDALIAANPQIPNPALIFPGQQICVPSPVPPANTWVDHLRGFIGRNDVVIGLLGGQTLECDPVVAVFEDHFDCHVGVRLRHIRVAASAYFQPPPVPPTLASKPSQVQQGNTFRDHLSLTPFVSLLTGQTINCIFREVFADHVDCSSGTRGTVPAHVRIEAIAFGERPL